MRTLEQTRGSTRDPVELKLELRPRARRDVIDITEHVHDRFGDVLGRFDRALYCSHHTTAGFLEQSFCSRLHHDRKDVESFMEAFEQLFPPNADYRHDQLHLRSELTAEEKLVEPLNADSHLTYIGSGLRNCVAYVNKPGVPVYFIDLDGMNGGQSRLRKTTIIGFDREDQAASFSLDVPVSHHPIDSINLRDDRHGIMARIHDELARCDIVSGRIRISLAPGERDAGLTVNEYETWLMKHDLIDVLDYPMRFVAERGLHMLQNPRAIPQKTRDYAKYDLVRAINQVLDALGLSKPRLESLLARLLARPASRLLRIRDSIDLLVTSNEDGGRSIIIQGRYQSPILMQWSQAPSGARKLDVEVTRFR